MSLAGATGNPVNRARHLLTMVTRFPHPRKQHNEKTSSSGLNG
jgi:hypothetical protein